MLLQVYKTLSDSVILDWYISLYDKDRMSSCTVTYSPTELNTTDENVLDFLPRRRTFLLQSLAPNTTYQFVMECADSAGRNYATKSITFKTGEYKLTHQDVEVLSKWNKCNEKASWICWLIQPTHVKYPLLIAT